MCKLLIGYRGFIALAHRTGKVSSIYPAIVHQGDQFSLKLGTGRQLVHAPVLDPAKRGDWIGAYAVVEFRDGRTDFEWMTRQEIEKVKQCSESASDAWSPWQRFEDEMIKKSPIRRDGQTTMPVERGHDAGGGGGARRVPRDGDRGKENGATRRPTARHRGGESLHPQSKILQPSSR